MCATTNRRSFLSLMLGGIGLSVIPGKVFAGSVHPEPREDIDASDVLTDDQVAKFGKSVQEVFGMIREIPEVADGIGCYCGCHTRPGYRSLLTCFHEGGRGMGCPMRRRLDTGRGTAATTSRAAPRFRCPPAWRAARARRGMARTARPCCLSSDRRCAWRLPWAPQRISASRM